jgi:transcriptional regulator with XRE-family HTH domain
MTSKTKTKTETKTRVKPDKAKKDARKADKDIFDAAVGRRVIRAMLDSGVTVEEVAIELGLTHGAVSGWRMGKAHIHPSDIRLIAKMTRTDFFWLLTGMNSDKISSLVTEETDTIQLSLTIPRSAQLAISRNGVQASLSPR